MQTARSTLGALVPAVLVTLATLVLFAGIYPLAVWAVSATFFAHQAGGSLIVRDGRTLGSEIVGQRFASPRYFFGRPSAAGKGDDPTQTGGTNLGPTSKKLIAQIAAATAALHKENPGAAIPADLVTSSASGIDPNISLAAALFQVPRVARTRGLSEATVIALVRAHAIGRTFAILGEPRINFLDLNHALDTL
ncbi:MAG: potassium-transporting ATPase subunit KdpC [Vulcanimicrobiaceae bacterium]